MGFFFKLIIPAPPSLYLIISKQIYTRSITKRYLKDNVLKFQRNCIKLSVFFNQNVVMLILMANVQEKQNSPRMTLGMLIFKIFFNEIDLWKHK